VPPEAGISGPNGTAQPAKTPSALQLPLWVCSDCRRTVEKEDRHTALEQSLGVRHLGTERVVVKWRGRRLCVRRENRGSSGSFERFHSFRSAVCRLTRAAAAGLSVDGVALVFTSVSFPEKRSSQKKQLFSLRKKRYKQHIMSYLGLCFIANESYIILIRAKYASQWINDHDVLFGMCKRNVLYTLELDLRYPSDLHGCKYALWPMLTCETTASSYEELLYDRQPG